MTQINVSDMPKETPIIADDDNKSRNDKYSTLSNKNEPTKKVLELLESKIDMSGNKVINVMAIGNEYVIYEVDAKDINDRLKVLIDGFSNESEKIMIEKFAKVKAKYTEAKGLLYRSENFGNMKNRIAHTLSSILVLDDDTDGNIKFQELINEIKKENRDVIVNKMAHVWPSFVFFAIVSLTCLKDKIWMIPKDEVIFNVYIVLFSSSLGGSLSVLYSIYKIRFDEFTNLFWYIASGIERIFLSVITGTIAFIFLKSKIVLQLSDSENHWSMMTILILASFSETFIPSMIGKIEKKSSKEQ